jgi:hydroxymethylpyrimidine/phosphomethylpyrimidine kinase
MDDLVVLLGVYAVPEEFVGEQLRSVLSDMSVDVVSELLCLSAFIFISKDAFQILTHAVPLMCVL